MKILIISTLTLLFFTFAIAYAEPEADYFPLAEGNYWVYQDQIEIQDPQGDFEIYNKYIQEKVKVKRINQLRTLKVLSTEIRGDFKITKMQEEGTPEGMITFFYIVDNKNGRIYSYGNEQIKMISPNNKGVTIKGSPEYIFPLQIGSKWGDSESLERKDKMYFFYVEKMEDVTVSAGTFKNCFKIVHYTLPDETIQWFCPNVGVVRLEYRHHGTIDNLVSELKKVNLSSPLIYGGETNTILVKALNYDLNNDGVEEQISLFAQPYYYQQDDLGGWDTFILKVVSGDETFESEIKKPDGSCNGTLEIIEISKKEFPFINLSYYAGAHAMGSRLFRFDGNLKLVNEFGSGEPFIDFKDIDNDGIVEAVVVHRDYSSGNPVNSKIIEIYEYNNGEFTLSSQTPIKLKFPVAFDEWDKWIEKNFNLK